MFLVAEKALRLGRNSIPIEPVHRVVNPREFNQRAVSLHVYSRPFDTCVVYSTEQCTCGVIKLHYDTAHGRPVPR